MALMLPINHILLMMIVKKNTESVQTETLEVQ
jgi:hypothetical protein